MSMSMSTSTSTSMNMSDSQRKPETTVSKKKVLTPNTKRNYNRNNRLWFTLLFIVALCAAKIWFSTLLLIDRTQPKLDRPAWQLEFDSTRRQSTRKATVGNTTRSVSSSLDATKAAVDLAHPIPLHSRENDQNNIIREVLGEDGHNTFVSYRLEYDKPYSVKYGPYTQCAIGTKTNKFGRKAITRVGLSESLSKILNVTAYLQTNLKIVSVGDSVLMQFHQVLEEALQPPATTTTTTTTGGAGLGNGNRHETDPYRTIYQEAWRGHESVVVAAPVNGGGVLAGFRMTGLLLEEGRGKPPPNANPNPKDASGGWIPEHVRQILDHNYTTTTTTTAITITGSDETTTTTTTSTTQSIGSFDVMIYRVPHGWLQASVVTRERLEKSLSLARELFGVRTIIIQTLFLNNNVKTMKDLNDMHATNRIIRDVVEASWANPDLPDLLLMDFGGWTDQLIELNARMAGMDTQSNANYTLTRLGCAKFPPSIAMACVEKSVKPKSCACTRNVMSIDGMHWCMETLGGRIIGGMSCLLQCSLLINGTDSDSDTKRHVLENCQQRCNDQFMSLREASSLLSPT